MPYGIIKVDTLTFTDAGVDKSVSISGLVQNPTITGNLTVTGTISGATVTGNTGQFTNLSGVNAGFTTVTGTTVTGTTANFVSGVFTTQVSGTTITGNTGRFSNITGVSGVFTTFVSGATVTGNTAQFTTLTGGTAGFTTVTGTTVTGTTAQFTTVTGGTAGFTTVTGTTVTGTTANFVSGVFTTQISGAAGAIAGNITASAFIPTGSGVPTNGVYLPSANTVGIAANSSGILFATSSGVGIGTTAAANITLHISGNSTQRFTNNANISGFDIGLLGGGADGTAYIFNRTSAGQIVFGADNADTARITTNGISLSQAGDYFAVNGTDGGGYFRALSSGAGLTGYTQHLWFRTNTGSNQRGFKLNTYDNAGSEQIWLEFSGNQMFAGLVYDNTTANAANVYVAAGGGFFRSTSSAKYKTDIEEIDIEYSKKLLDCRPVWYRSKAEHDNKNWSWWGFIAEEIDQIDPRLVNYGYSVEDYEYVPTGQIEISDDGEEIQIKEQKLKDTAQLKPESVAYDRFVPHLLALIKYQQEQIDSLKESIDMLKNK